MPTVLPTAVRDVPIKSLRLDPRCQLRADIRQSIIQDYHDVLEEELEAAKAAERDPVWPFPPLDVFWRVAGPNLVADGWHRTKAAQIAKWPNPIPCVVHDGDLRDAILWAANANSTHGIRRSNEDKRKTIITLLHDREWRKWSSNEIARRCNVSASLVEIVRRHEGGAADPEQRLHFRGDGRIGYSPRDRDRNRKKTPTLAEQVAATLHDTPTHCPYCGRRMEED